MIGKVTKRTVEAVPPNALLWDTSLVGFGVRRQLRHPFYVVRYRWHGAQRIDSIGRHGPWTADTARAEALRRLALVATGTDPRTPKGDTVGALVERYLEAKADLRTYYEASRYLRKVAEPLHNRPLTIDRRAVSALLADVEAQSGGTSRNRLRSWLSSLFAWAISEGLAEVNPVTGTGKAVEVSRDRVLSPAELGALWRGLGDGHFPDIVRLLILTGQRRNEIGGLRWSEIVGATIVLPPERTKNRRAHVVPLSPAALAIIQRQHRQWDCLFAVEGFTNWHKPKVELDARIRIAPYTLHDIRRSAATGLAELGVLPHIIEAVLNHVSGHRAGVAGIYNRARYEGEMREALAKWAKHVEGLR